MTDAIEVYVDIGDKTLLVGCCRYVAKRRGQSSVFEYTDTWLDHADAFLTTTSVVTRYRR